jgi:hypothetical protein
MSVWPLASQTCTPLGTEIIAAGTLDRSCDPHPPASSKLYLDHIARQRGRRRCQACAWRCNRNRGKADRVSRYRAGGVARQNTLLRLRRQECRRFGWTSYRRATSAIFAPGANVSSTNRSFSAVVHRRRRSGPERTVTVI